MTGQVTDTFVFKSEEYELIGVEGEGLASPEQFGMTPEMMHTACYRGFYATYELTEQELLLREFTLREASGNYLPIGGVESGKGDKEGTYRNLDVSIPFSGSLRLAKDMIPELYIHMGFQKPTAFAVVWDVVLSAGKVVRIRDRSAEVEEKRGAFKRRYESGDMIKGIEDAFTLDMDLE